MSPPPPRSTLFPYTTLFRSMNVEGISADPNLVPQPTRWAVPDDPALGSKRGSGCFAYKRSQVKRPRSEEHTSELQSQSNLVCRLLLEKKKDILDRSSNGMEC